MRAKIGNRVSAVVFAFVPLLAIWALSPAWSVSQTSDLPGLLAISMNDAASNAVSGSSAASGDAASQEPITDLSDWNYTADPMSPVGKTTFNRRLLSTTQPGPHATPAGPNPRVPWITRPASLGDPPVMNPLVQSSILAQTMATNVLSPSDATGSLASQSNLLRFATPSAPAATTGAATTGAATTTVTTPQTLSAVQSVTLSQSQVALLQNAAAPQKAQSFAFQPVKSGSLGSAMRRQGRLGASSE